MAKDTFRNLLNDIKMLQEEVTSGDIATVEPVKHKKGKKCKMHKRINCQDCTNEKD